MDRKTRKLFIIYGWLHPKPDVDRLYIPRKDAGKGLVVTEDCVELAVWELKVHLHGSEERPKLAARRNRINDLEAASVLKKAKKWKRLQDWEENVLHAPYLRQTKEVRSKHSWIWFQNRDLKRETESLMVTGQDQSIRTN